MVSFQTCKSFYVEHIAALQTEIYRVAACANFSNIIDLSNHRPVGCVWTNSSDVQLETNMSQQQIQHPPHKKDDDWIQV